jgi:hypothetical protein
LTKARKFVLEYRKPDSIALRSSAVHSKFYRHFPGYIAIVVLGISHSARSSRYGEVWGYYPHARLSDHKARQSYEAYLPRIRHDFR